MSVCTPSDIIHLADTLAKRPYVCPSHSMYQTWCAMNMVRKTNALFGEKTKVSFMKTNFNNCLKVVQNILRQKNLYSSLFSERMQHKIVLRTDPVLNDLFFLVTILGATCPIYIYIYIYTHKFTHTHTHTHTYIYIIPNAES